MHQVMQKYNPEFSRALWWRCKIIPFNPLSSSKYTVSFDVYMTFKVYSSFWCVHDISSIGFLFMIENIFESQSACVRTCLVHPLPERFNQLIYSIHFKNCLFLRCYCTCGRATEILPPKLLRVNQKGWSEGSGKLLYILLAYEKTKCRGVVLATLL